MSLYDQNQVSGQETTWKRCNQILITNPLVGTPQTVFMEEQAISLPDGTEITQAIPGSVPIQVQLTNPSVEIPLMDFSSGVPVATNQTISAQALSYALYSAYLYYAELRDAAAVNGSNGANQGIL